MITQPYVNFIQPVAGGNVKPVSKGKIYIGKEGLDPKLGGVSIYYRDNQGVEKEIANPIYLNMTGVAVASQSDSTIINPYTNDPFSILIENQSGEEVYSKLTDVVYFQSAQQVNDSIRKSQEALTDSSSEVVLYLDGTYGQDATNCTKIYQNKDKLWFAWESPTGTVTNFVDNNDYGTATLTTTTGTFEFVKEGIYNLRGMNPFAITSPLGYGAVTYDKDNVVDSYAAIQRCFDESKHKTVYLGQWFYSSQGLLTPDSANYDEYGFKVIGCNSGDACIVFASSVLRGLSLRQMPTEESKLDDPANYTYTGTIERNIHLEDFSLWSDGFTKQPLSRGCFLYYTSMLTMRNIQCRGFEVGTDLWCWASTIQSVRNRDCDVGLNYFTGTTTTIISPYSGNCRLGYRIGGKDDTIAGDVGYPIARPITLTFISPAADAITQDAYYINDAAGVEFVSPSNEGSTRSMFNIRKTNSAVIISNPTHAKLPAFPTSQYFITFGAGYNRQVKVSGFNAQLEYSVGLTGTIATGDIFEKSILQLESFFDLKDNPIGNMQIDYVDGVSQKMSVTDGVKIKQGSCYVDIPKTAIGFGRRAGAMANFEIMSVIHEDGTTSKTFSKANVMMYSGDGLNISSAFVDSIESRNYQGNGTAMTVSGITALPNQNGDVVRFDFNIPATNYQGNRHVFRIKMNDQIEWPLNFNN